MNNKVKHEHILNALAEVLSDAKFMAAPQMSAFLKYVVEQTLEGNSKRIKAYTVAVDALGKSANFDPQNDPSVRVLAKRLRSSLDLYYERSPLVSVKIILKTGSYVPSFERVFTDVTTKSQYAVTHTPQHVQHDMNVQPHCVKSHDSQAVAIPNLQLKQNLAPNNKTNESPDNSGSISAQSISSMATENSRFPEHDEHGKKDNVQADAAARPALPEVLLQEEQNDTCENNQSSIFNSAKAAAAVVLLAGILWFTVDRSEHQPGNTELAAAMPDNSVQAIAYEAGVPIDKDQISQTDSRLRPELPTIFIAYNSAIHDSSDQIADFVSIALSEFDTVQVYRNTLANNKSRYWPEDYKLNISNMQIDESMRVTFQLLHAQTGLVVLAESLTFESLSNSGFSGEDLKNIESLAARLVRGNSAMMQNFRANTNKTSHVLHTNELAGTSVALLGN